MQRSLRWTFVGWLGVVLCAVCAVCAGALGAEEPGLAALGGYSGRSELAPGITLTLTVKKPVGTVCGVTGALVGGKGGAVPVSGWFSLRTGQLRAVMTVPGGTTGLLGEKVGSFLPLDGELPAAGGPLVVRLRSPKGQTVEWFTLSHQTLADPPAPPITPTTTDSAATTATGQPTGPGLWVLRAGYPQCRTAPIPWSDKNIRLDAKVEGPRAFVAGLQTTGADGQVIDTSYRFGVSASPPVTLRPGQQFELTVTGATDRTVNAVITARLRPFDTLLSADVLDVEPAGEQGAWIGVWQDRVAKVSHCRYRFTFNPHRNQLPTTLRLTSSLADALVEWTWDLKDPNLPASAPTPNVGTATPATPAAPAGGGSAAEPKPATEDTRARVGVTWRQGPVEFNRDGKWATLPEGETLRSGDFVRVARAGGAVLRFDDGSTVELRAGSVVAVKLLLRPDGRAAYDLAINAGRATATRDPLAMLNDFVLATPEARAVSTHTVYSVAYDPDARQTTVEVADGQVLVLPVAAAQRPVWAEAGEKLRVDAQRVTTLAPPTAPSDFYLATAPQTPASPAGGAPATQPTGLVAETLVVARGYDERQLELTGIADEFRNVPRIRVAYSFQGLAKDTSIDLVIQREGVEVARGGTFAPDGQQHRFQMPFGVEDGPPLPPGNYLVVAVVSGKVTAQRPFVIGP